VRPELPLSGRVRGEMLTNVCALLRVKEAVSP
jgi:hypothetical protein